MDGWRTRRDETENKIRGRRQRGRHRLGVGSGAVQSERQPHQAKCGPARQTFAFKQQIASPRQLRKRRSMSDIEEIVLQKSARGWATFQSEQ